MSFILSYLNDTLIGKSPSGANPTPSFANTMGARLITSKLYLESNLITATFAPRKPILTAEKKLKVIQVFRVSRKSFFNN